ncbi:hypothetical protein QR98_0055000 [Sarcoptes scabiei]|uniref:Uncharacterized protein n=1 Tax=Sarcoptes scabiei TaxID=52283 RepID=A0A132A7R9_SARSC|nr:hypothetical protein QR98_0055000 [Sarcoptes scabiei]
MLSLCSGKFFTINSMMTVVEEIHQFQIDFVKHQSTRRNCFTLSTFLSNEIYSIENLIDNLRAP